MKTISLSILSMSDVSLANFGETVRNIEFLCKQVKQTVKSLGADINFSWHIDIMDGQYIPDTISICPQMLRQIAMTATMPVDLHFMTMSIRPYVKAIEAFDNSLSKINEIQVHLLTDAIDELLSNDLPALSKYTGAITFNPNEQLASALLDCTDSVLLMSVVPGKGGQSYIPVDGKIKDVKQYDAGIRIAVDGGVNADTVENCKDADTIIIGSAAMKAYDNGNFKDFMLDIARKFLDV